MVVVADPVEDRNELGDAANPVEDRNELDDEVEGPNPTLLVLLPEMEVVFEIVLLLAPLAVSPGLLTQNTRLLPGFAGFCSAKMPLKEV